VTAALFDTGPQADLRWLIAAAVVSVGLHLALAAGVSTIPPREPQEPVWVEMAVATVEPEPEPQPAPEPEPEPEPEPKEPEVVDYEPEPEPVPEPPPQARPLPRPTQGLSNDSFMKGSGGGDVRAGNTTAVGATQELMEQGEATDSVIVPYAAVTNAPRVRFKPTLEVPESVSAAGIQGRVEVLLTVDVEGKVSEVSVVSSLHPDADAACVDAMKKSRWKPGDKDGAPVITRNVPYSCKFEMSAD
jgi:TonB family protein